MKTSQAGVNFIKGFEGDKLTAYQDSVGVWTIGYGHTGAEVVPAMTITQQQAEDLLKHDLIRFEDGVTNAVKVPLNQCQFDALVCFSYNLGLHNLQTSTLLKLLNNGDYEGAAGQFAKWDRAGGQVLAGLLRRRNGESALFSFGQYDDQDAVEAEVNRIIMEE